MSLLVTGSIGIDTVTTPFGKSTNCIGGSAVYFSMAASHFSPVRFVGVIGNDCPFDLHEVFKGRDVDLAGLEVRSESKTFRWQGSYVGDMSNAMTDSVELNVLAETPPTLPHQFADSKYVFLANTHPALQIQLLNRLSRPKFVAADTMNCWIENYATELKELLSKIDAIIINEGEARMITQKDNLAAAASEIRKMGPKVVIIKKGEHGSISIDADGNWIVIPSYPSAEVKDPTGAGDSFAGAMIGYLASVDKIDAESLKKAIAYGTVTASFAIEGFSLTTISETNREIIDQRLEMLRKITGF
ncbi:MAG: bifunctional hydroxymethylpyrimidine kinase/phosphomethylpyrimidine kinase [Anaerohalosphaeraceae bacterium]|nr:bifunctional hydroxymethylpyrimidine kinase/phosphomethylpyrimidine kinase [Anaerohalosphaeraceae bacterium]